MMTSHFFLPECHSYIKSSPSFCEGEQSPLGLTCRIELPSSGTPSQMAEEASCTAHVLNWIGTQSVLHNHMHISPHSCTTNVTLMHGPWLLLANPVSVLQLKY